MTEHLNEDDAKRLVRKAVMARSFTDPLGAKGFRKPFERIERERRARRLTATAALAAFAGLFGLIIVTAPESQPETPLTPADNTAVIAEIPIPGDGPEDPVTIVRVLLPDGRTTRDVQTRAS